MTITGTGTKSNPWVIHNKDDLYEVTDVPSTTAGANPYWQVGTYLKLGADIDLAGEMWDRSFGTVKNIFYGNFDGDGHTIRNMYTSTPTARNPRSLFHYCGDYSHLVGQEIKNLTMENSYICGKGIQSAFISYGYYVRMSNCYAKNCVISGPGITSIFIGCPGEYQTTTITNCHATDCYVLSTTGSGSNVGGIVADSGGPECEVNISNCSLDNCYLECGSKDYSYAGGISGGHEEGRSTIDNCTVTNCTIRGQAGAAGISAETATQYPDATLRVSNCRVENCCIDAQYAGAKNYGYASWWLNLGMCKWPANYTVTNCTGRNNNIHGRLYEQTLPAGNTESGITTQENCFLTVATADIEPKSGDIGTDFMLQRTGLGCSLNYDETNGLHTAAVTDRLGTYYVYPGASLRNTDNGKFTPSIVFCNHMQALPAVSLAYTVGTAGPVLQVYADGSWHDGTPYVYTGSAWVEADAVFVHDGSSWKESAS